MGRVDVAVAARIGALLARLEASGSDDNAPSLERMRVLLGAARQKIADHEARIAALEARVVALEVRVGIL